MFNLTDSEKQNRVVDLIDVVKDQVIGRINYLNAIVDAHISSNETATKDPPLQLIESK